METMVEFESNLFIPFLPEESQVNPQVYGAELTYWLSKKLAEKGVVTTYPNNEDWGWFIEHITDSGDEYWLCCSNTEGAHNKWMCFLDPKAKKLFGRDKAKLENATPLLSALQSVLNEEPGITNIVWREEKVGA